MHFSTLIHFGKHVLTDLLYQGKCDSVAKLDVSVVSLNVFNIKLQHWYSVDF